MNKARKLLAQHGKVAFLAAPTALEPLPRLTRLLNGPKIFIKRDDCTGLAFGGNKTRKLEYVVADAKAQHADLLITNGAPQSNHARQTAAAAARSGLACDLLLAPWADGATGLAFETGNLLLSKLLGATIHPQADDDNLGEAMRQLAEQRKQEGRRPYIINVGASSALGSLGYVSCAAELHDQAMEQGLTIDCVVLATGSCGTQAGLLTGLHLLEAATRVIGVSVSPDGEQLFRRGRIATLTAEILALAGETSAVPESRIEVRGEYCGSAYGVPDHATLEAIDLLARHEGLFLDPVYTGKGMAGLIDQIRQGRFSRDDTVVFLHTGGTPALFACDELLSPGH